jgi:hypothetical protein
MELLNVPAGTTSRDIIVPIYDSSITTGAKLSGLVYNTSGLVAYYTRQGVAGAAVQISLADKTKGTWASGGFIAADGTNMPGDYELGVPDEALAAGAAWVKIQLRGASNMKPVDIIVDLSVKSASSLVDDIHAEVIEGTLTAAGIQRILLAGIAGISSDDGKEFFGLNGTTKRIDGTVVGRNRTVVTLDGS